MQRLEDFRIFYNHTIQPELVRLDRSRLRLLTLLTLSVIILAAVLTVEMLVGIWLLTLITVLPISLYITWLIYRIRLFILRFKPRVVRLILDFIDDGVNYGSLTYDPKGGIPVEKFHASLLFGTPADVYLAEDLIEGKIGELPFTLCELNVREFSQVRSRLNYVFKGVFLHATSIHDVNGAIVIWPRIFRQYLSRAIREVSKNGGRSIEELIKSPRFREKYTAYATREARVRTVLSEIMQEAIVNYAEKSEKEIYIAFIGKEIYAAVTEPHNILEPALFQSNVSFDLLREFFEDIQLVLQIVEDFDANN